MRYATFAAVLVALLAWAGARSSLASDSPNVTAVNDSVEAAAGQTYDSVKTVNGNVLVRSGATVGSAHTVNGEIELERDAKAGDVNTVNGSLTIADGAAVARDASTVNGEVRIASRSRVGGNVSTVSGEIELSGAEVGGKVTSVNGDIDLTNGARVRGDIVVRKPNGGWSWGNGNDDLVKVHVCATCVVEGDLRFERPVELRLDNGAKVGKVIGDKVTRR
jgi:cytoskeletal protein CcmA (bactofilin family)